ncbi:hypothetical protein FRX31_017696, partial [Thalictrum thalictroides]
MDIIWLFKAPILPVIICFEVVICEVDTVGLAIQQGTTMQCRWKNYLLRRMIGRVVLEVPHRRE